MRWNMGLIMATIYYPNGKEKPIKNLGWVLRRASRYPIEQITINKLNGTFGIGADLKVRFKDKVRFETDFASFSVLCQWLNSRRSWYGSKVAVYHYGQKYCDMTLEKYSLGRATWR